MADPGPNEVCEDCAKGPYKPEEEEVDEYDQIINNSGCAAEHYNMQVKSHASTACHHTHLLPVITPSWPLHGHFTAPSQPLHALPLDHLFTAP